MGRKLVKLFFHFFSVLLFFVVTSYVLLAAYGYQIDLLNKDIIKVSIIDLQNKIDGVRVYLDEKLVSEKLPRQLKDISPGAHDLRVEKDGYKVWKKHVNVLPDLALQIDSIIMIPEDLSQYLTTVEIDFPYNHYVYNDKFIIFITSGEKKIHICKLNGDGDVVFEHINFPLDTTDMKIEFISDIHLLFKGVDDSFILNLNNKDLEEYKKPDIAEEYFMAFVPDLKLFYSVGNSLFVADVNEEKAGIPSILYESADNNSEDFEYKIIDGNILIGLTDGLARFYDGKLVMIDEDIRKPILADSNGLGIFYVAGGEEVMFKENYNKESVMLARFSSEIDKMQLFGDNKHILIQSGGTLDICEDDFTFCMNLLDIDDSQDVTVFSGSGKMFVINSDTLDIYDLKQEKE